MKVTKERLAGFTLTIIVITAIIVIMYFNGIEITTYSSPEEYVSTQIEGSVAIINSKVKGVAIITFESGGVRVSDLRLEVKKGVTQMRLALNAKYDTFIVTDLISFAPNYKTIGLAVALELMAVIVNWILIPDDEDEEPE